MKFFQIFCDVLAAVAARVALDAVIFNGPSDCSKVQKHNGKPVCTGVHSFKRAHITGSKET
jgi:hypothetical protein